MFAQTKYDIGNIIFSPDGDEDAIVGVRVTNLRGTLEECYLLEHGFVWYSLPELREVNNGK